MCSPLFTAARCTDTQTQVIFYYCIKPQKVKGGVFVYHNEEAFLHWAVAGTVFALHDQLVVSLCFWLVCVAVLPEVTPLCFSHYWNSGQERKRKDGCLRCTEVVERESEGWMNDGWISRTEGSEIWESRKDDEEKRGRRKRLVGWVELLGESMSECCWEPGLLLEATCLAGEKEKRREK